MFDKQGTGLGGGVRRKEVTTAAVVDMGSLTGAPRWSHAPLLVTFRTETGYTHVIEQPPSTVRYHRWDWEEEDLK